MSEVNRVAVICNMYPSEDAPHFGVFIKREVEALRRLRPNTEIRVWHINTRGVKLRYLLDRRGVQEEVRDWRPSVIHCHYGFTPWFAPRGAAPVVCTYHGTDLTIAWKRRVSLLMGSRVDHGIIVSESLARLAPSRTSVTLIPCGVDGIFVPRYPRETTRQKGLPSELTLLFPSDPRRVEKDFPLFKGVVSELQQRGLRVRCLTLDQVPPRLVVDRMNEADVLLMTSSSEGSPVTIREALCCGCRVVTTDVGDVRRWLPLFSGCRVVDNRSVHDLADACTDVFSEQGPDSVQARSMLTVDSEAMAVAQVYEKLIGRES